MPKTSPEKNRIQHTGFRTVTALVFAGVAVVFLLLYALLVKFTSADPLKSGILLIVLYAAVCAAVYYLFEQKTKAGVVYDETLIPVMGRIMYDAVVRMDAPVFICNSDERIVWTNRAAESLLSDRKKFKGEAFRELFGVTLADVRADQTGDECRLEYAGRSFRTQYNHIKSDDGDFALVMTTEVTEYERLNAKAAGDEPVVCYILMDNLSEMLQYDSEQYRPAAARIDEILRDWAEEYGGILKEYERDKYLFITEKRTLEKLIDGKFELLDRVRNVRVGETNLPLTISMGVSSSSGSFEDKERAAHAALDLALQRGGDQAVVKGDNSTDFYGGVNKSVQKRTNVRARVVSNELTAAVKQASNVIIMGHKFADFDAFGAAAGLSLIAMYCGTPVKIVLDHSNRNLIGCRNLLAPDERFGSLFVDPSSALDLLQTGTLVVIADVNSFSVCEVPELAARSEKLAVIDHHRKTAEFEREPDVEYIEPSASSACELVAEMLEQVLPKDDCSAAVANALLAGITLDTQQFTKNTGTRTFSAAMYLRDRGADPVLVQTLFRESLDDYRQEAKFRSNAEIYRGVCAITIVDEPDAADRVIAAKAANNLLMVDGIEASFALMRTGDTVHVSARSNGKLNVQLVMEALDGGGHFESAAAQFRDSTFEETIEALHKAIDTVLDGN